MSAVTFDKDTAKWQAGMINIEDLKLDHTFYKTTQQKLSDVFAYIHGKNWEKETPLKIYYKRDTKLAHGILYLGGMNFYIHLYRYFQNGAFKKVKCALAYNALNKKARIDVKGCSHGIGDTLPMCDREREIALTYPFQFGHVFTVLRSETKQSFYMERFECELTDQIEKGLLFGRPLTPYDQLTFAIQLTKDLHFLHQNGFFHGDLVPWNCLAKRKYADHKIIVQMLSHLHDFGLAFRSDELKKYLDKELGNMLYFPPEIIRYSLISDASLTNLNLKAWEVWALGKILQELFCRNLVIPWVDYPACLKDPEKKKLHSHQLAQQLKNYEKPIGYDPNDPLQTIIVQMLDYDPKKRPELEEVLQQLNIIRDNIARPANYPSIIPQTLEPVVQCILRNSWNEVPTYTRFTRKATSFPAGFIYLGEGKFYIHLNRYTSAKEKVGVIYEPAKQDAKLCLYNSYPDIENDDAQTTEEIYAVVFKKGDTKRSVISEY